jgi:7-keto-8-aminopelargonate synthetase-like enzyme
VPWILFLTILLISQSHPEVVAAGIKALEDYGAGLSSVRFICGTQSIHKVS